jgi:hypothetical protein
MLPVFDEPSEETVPRGEMARPVSAPEPARTSETLAAAPPEDDDVAAARARIAAVGASTAAPVEAYEPDEAERTVARSGLSFEQGDFGEGSARPGPRGQGPEGWTVKGNSSSMLFHTPDSPWYRRTKAEVWFRDEESAAAAGFRNALDDDEKAQS